MITLKRLLWFPLIFSFFLKIESKEQRNLAIVLDLINQDIGYSFTSMLLYGLIETKTVPILTTTSSLENCNAIYQITLEKEKWCIYKKNDFVLLIPIINLDNYNHGFNLAGFYKDESFSSNNSPNQQYYKRVKRLIYKLINHKFLFPIKLTINSEKFIKLFDQLIKSKNELQDIEWNIYMAGHGMPIFSTCGLTETCFKKFLNILQEKANTHTLYYNSCYSSGKKNDYLFTNNEKYSFPIFCQCLNDNPSSALVSFNYVELFNNLAKIDNNKKETFCNLVENVFDQFDTINLNPNNIVTVRFPNMSEFEVINIDSKILSISNTNVVPDEIKCKNLVLTTDYYNSTLKLSQDTKIATFLKGDAVHYIERIDAEKLDYVNLFINFFSVEELIYRKIFLINEITCLDPDDKKTTLNNVILLFNCATPMQKQIVDFEGFAIDDNNNPFAIYLDKYKSRCGDKKHYCWHFTKYDVKPKTAEIYLHFFKNIKNAIEQNQQLDRKIYNEKTRESYILCRQGYKILKPIILGTLLYNFLNNDHVKNNTAFQYCKNLFVFYSIYSILSNKSEKHINTIFDKVFECEDIL